MLDAFSITENKCMLLNAIDMLAANVDSLRLGGTTMGLDVAAVASAGALVDGALDVCMIDSFSCKKSAPHSNLHRLFRHQPTQLACSACLTSDATWCSSSTCFAGNGCHLMWRPLPTAVVVHRLAGTVFLTSSSAHATLAVGQKQMHLARACSLVLPKLLTVHPPASNALLPQHAAPLLEAAIVAVRARSMTVLLSRYLARCMYGTYLVRVGVGRAPFRCQSCTVSVSQ